MRLIIAGDGPSRDSLQRLAAGHAIEFLGFVTERDVLARLLASADVVLAPGPLETFCLAALEALASGTPVVASASSAVREVLGTDDTDETDAQVGAVAADNATAFADAVDGVLSTSPAARRFAARRRAEQFPWSLTIDRMLALHGASPREPKQQAA